MIHKVVIRNFRNQELVLPLSDISETGLAVSDISGIGPDSVNLYATERASYDGASTGSSRRGIRYVTLLLRFIGTDELSVEDVRHTTYRFFPTRQPVEITIHGDNRISMIKGRVESNTPVIFSQNSYTQIVVECVDPYFKDRATGRMHEVVFHGRTPLFEFEWENNPNPPYPDHQQPGKTLLMGNIERMSITNIFYEGDVPTGIIFEFRVDSPLPEPSDIYIYNNTTKQEMRLKTANLKIPGETEGLKQNDVITVSTINGEKSILLQREGVIHNIFFALELDGMTWISLQPGDNLIAFESIDNTQSLSMRLYYDLLYEGV